MGEFVDKDERFFRDPGKIQYEISDPSIAYAETRSFIIDSGASDHRIGHNRLTEAEKRTIRPVENPFEIQSASGTLTISKEVRVYVPALNIKVWAQLMDDCPAVLSLGILCSKEGWSYEWRSGKNPMLSKGNIRIQLVQKYDVPMVFSAQSGESDTEISPEDACSTSASSSERATLRSKQRRGQFVRIRVSRKKKDSKQKKEAHKKVEVFDRAECSA